MTGTIAWAVMLIAAVLLEARVHWGRSGIGVERILSVLWSRLPTRLILIAAWAFIGWHVFARYTVPG